MGRKKKIVTEKEETKMVDVPEVEIKKDVQRPTFIKDPICPRCGTVRSRIRATIERRQYRECINPVCRKRFTSDAIVL